MESFSNKCFNYFRNENLPKLIINNIALVPMVFKECHFKVYLLVPV